MFFFLMILLPPSSTLTHTLFPYTTLFRSVNSLARRSFLLFVPSAPMASAHGRTKEKGGARSAPPRSEEHTSELQSLMRISYAVFCLKKKKKKIKAHIYKCTHKNELNRHKHNKNII